MAKDVHGQDYTEIVDEMGTWWQYKDGIKILVQPSQLWLDQNADTMQLSSNPNNKLNLLLTNLRLNTYSKNISLILDELKTIKEFLRNKYTDFPI